MTLADRRVCSSSAISPKKSPGPSVCVGPSDLDLCGARQDDEEAASVGVAFDERLAGREAAALTDLRHPFEIVVGELLEEADLAEGVGIARHLISPADLPAALAGLALILAMRARRPRRGASRRGRGRPPGSAPSNPARRTGRSTETTARTRPSRK